MVSGSAVNGEFGFSVAVGAGKLAVGSPNGQVGDLAPVVASVCTSGHPQRTHFGAFGNCG